MHSQFKDTFIHSRFTNCWPKNSC